MNKKKTTVSTVDEYIEQFPKEVQKALRQIRAAVKRAAPGSIEKISYQMPAYAMTGNLVYFAAHKSHIGFYPTSSGIAAFKEQLSRFAGAKGTVRFPLDKPIPVGLIAKIVRFRVEEDRNKTRLKTKRAKGRMQD
jgi:uncharacterized protein YdhG (YjbR/CyaY superfamily)